MNDIPSEGAAGQNSTNGADHQDFFGQSSTSSDGSRAVWLMAELASTKTQEQCLMQIIGRCSQVLNKLKVEELQLRAIAREERNNPGSAVQNGVLSPSSVLSTMSSQGPGTETAPDTEPSDGSDTLSLPEELIQ